MKFLNVKRPRLFVETRFIASENSRNKQLLSNEAPSRLDAINRVSTKAEKPAYPAPSLHAERGAPAVILSAAQDLAVYFTDLNDCSSASLQERSAVELTR